MGWICFCYSLRDSYESVAFLSSASTAVLTNVFQLRTLFNASVRVCGGCFGRLSSLVPQKCSGGEAVCGLRTAPPDLPRI